VDAVFQEAVHAAVPLFSITDSGPLSHTHHALQPAHGHEEGHQPLQARDDHRTTTTTATQPAKQQPKAVSPRRLAAVHPPLPERPLPELPSTAELYVAQYDYMDDQREGILHFSRFDIIALEERRNDGWWLGKLPNGQSGYFPASYVLPVNAPSST
jgi:hypothetical protein